MEVTRRRGRRRRKLLDGPKDRRGYSHLKEDALDRTMWRNRFRGGFGTVVRQNTEWMNEQKLHIKFLYHFCQGATVLPSFPLPSLLPATLFTWTQTPWCYISSSQYLNLLSGFRLHFACFAVAAPGYSPHSTLGGDSLTSSFWCLLTLALRNFIFWKL